MFNVGFLSSGVTRACLNDVGKVPVRRDVLIMCVSAGKSEGEIAWRRCVGIGSKGHVVGWLERRSSVRGQKEKMGVWAVDVVGWRSCVCGGENWLLIVLGFFCEESGEVISYYRSGGRWWRGTEERMKCSEEIGCLERCWSCCGNMMIWQCGLQQRKMKAKTNDGSFDLHHFLFAALSLVRCSQRTSDNTYNLF